MRKSLAQTFDEGLAWKISTSHNHVEDRFFGLGRLSSRTFGLLARHHPEERRFTTTAVLGFGKFRCPFPNWVHI